MASTLSLFSTNGVVASAPASGSLPFTLDSASSSGAYFSPFSGLRGKSALSSNASSGGQFLSSRFLIFRSYKQRRSSVVSMAAEEASVPSLNDLPLIQYINQQGRIQPPVQKATKASVFAIFDEKKEVQYIGFSKDVRNSLRTLMGRRPTLCYYYKWYNLDCLNHQKMLSCRQQWVSELGLPPVGNADPVQKNLWEQSADAGSVSERGREAAAISMAKSFLQTMADRGLKEEMVYDPELLAAGKCDVLPSVNQTVEEMPAAARVQAEEAAGRRAVVVTSSKGDTVEFSTFFESKFPTNGRWMYDTLVSKDDKETRDPVISGRVYPEAVNTPKDRAISSFSSPTLESGAKDIGDFVEVGYIANTHGVHGELHVYSLTDFPEERFEKPGKRWVRSKTMGKPVYQEVELLEGREVGGKRPSWLITLDSFNSVEKASDLVGSALLVTERPSLDDDEFYIPDLIGMAVILQDTGQEIGVILDVYNTGGDSDLLQVRRTDGTSGHRVWIPFVKEIVPVVDKDRRRVEINPPAGLLELNSPCEKKEKVGRKKKFRRKKMASSSLESV